MILKWRKSGLDAAVLTPKASCPSEALNPTIMLKPEWPELAHLVGAVAITDYAAMCDSEEYRTDSEIVLRGCGYGAKRLGSRALRAIAEIEIPSIERKIREYDSLIQQMAERWPLVPGGLIGTAEDFPSEENKEVRDLLRWWNFSHRNYGDQPLQRRLARRGVLYDHSRLPVPSVGDAHAGVYVARWVATPGRMADPLEEALTFWRSVATA